jgi:hypothetical protein
MENIKKYTYYISDLHFTIGDKNYCISNSHDNNFICRVTNLSSANKDEIYKLVTLSTYEVYNFLQSENGRELTINEICKLEEFFGEGFFKNTLQPNTKVLKYYSGFTYKNVGTKRVDTYPDFIFYIHSLNESFRIAIWDSEKYISYQITGQNINNIYAKGSVNKSNDMNIEKYLNGNDYHISLSINDNILTYGIKQMEKSEPSVNPEIVATL